jgi:hypothetical protein
MKPTDTAINWHVDQEAEITESNLEDFLEYP